jgi:hypothetical protein
MSAFSSWRPDLNRATLLSEAKGSSDGVEAALRECRGMCQLFQRQRRYANLDPDARTTTRWPLSARQLRASNHPAQAVSSGF